jgi:malignant T-cell-amplified sequence
MFRKFDFKEDVSGQTLVKSSVQRGIKTTLTDRAPSLEAVIEDILPKKSILVQWKCRDRISLYVLDEIILFFSSFDGPLFPTLRLLHQCTSSSFY